MILYSLEVFSSLIVNFPHKVLVFDCKKDRFEVFQCPTLYDRIVKNVPFQQDKYVSYFVILIGFSAKTQVVKVISKKELKLLGDHHFGFQPRVFELKDPKSLEDKMKAHQDFEQLNHMFLYWTATRKTRIAIIQVGHIMAGRKSSVRMFKQQIKEVFQTALEKCTEFHNFAPEKFDKLKVLCERLLPLLDKLPEYKEGTYKPELLIER